MATNKASDNINYLLAACPRPCMRVVVDQEFFPTTAHFIIDHGKIQSFSSSPLDHSFSCLSALQQRGPVPWHPCPSFHLPTGLPARHHGRHVHVALRARSRREPRRRLRHFQEKDREEQEMPGEEGRKGNQHCEGNHNCYVNACHSMVERVKSRPYSGVHMLSLCNKRTHRMHNSTILEWESRSVTPPVCTRKSKSRNCLGLINNTPILTPINVLFSVSCYHLRVFLVICGSPDPDSNPEKM
jgi:hypothetical protein